MRAKTAIVYQVFGCGGLLETKLNPVDGKILKAVEPRIAASVLNISSDVEKMLLYWRLNWGHR